MSAKNIISLQWEHVMDVMAVPTAYSENEVGQIRPRKIGYWKSSMTAQTDDRDSLRQCGDTVPVG